MLVKITHSVVLDGTPLHKGKTYELNETEAKALVTHGEAVLVEVEKLNQNNQLRKRKKKRNNIPLLFCMPS